MRINYVIALYMGDKRNPRTPDWKYCLDRQLATLDELGDTSISKITIALNVRSTSDETVLRRFLNDYKAEYLSPRLEVYARPNVDYSYGAWNFVVQRTMNDFDYFFLMEDDYCPTQKGFIQPFLDEMNIGVAYVCQAVSHTNGQRHAGMSIGLLNSAIARDVYSRRGELFKLCRAKQYHEAEWNQVHFLDNFTDLGYTFNDVSHVCSVRFLDYWQNITEHGVADGVRPVEPIIGEE